MENTLQLGNLLKEGTYPEEYTGGKNWTILHGDTLKLVKAFQPGIFDAVMRLGEQNRMSETARLIRNTAV